MKNHRRLTRAVCRLLLVLLLLSACVLPARGTGDDPLLPETFSAAEELSAEESPAEEPSARGSLTPPVILTVNTVLQVPVSAPACLLMDAATGTVLAARNAEEQRYPASVTKIMTLLLVCEAIEAGRLAKGERLTCSETAAAKGGSQIWLEPGEIMSVDDLLKAAFVYSANDACTLLGEAVAGSETAFVRQMNEKAAALGMKHTHFDNCTGLDDDTETHLSTAYDIALMSRALLRFDWIRDYTTVWMDTLRNGQTQLVNTNRLIRTYPGATGLKTGTTSKAGCCVAATAEREGMTLIAVVLGADSSKSRFADAAALLDYGFANYELFSPALPESALAPLSVRYSLRETLPVEAAEAAPLLLNRGASADVTVRIERPEDVEAPVSPGQQVGSVAYYAGNVRLAEVPLLAAAQARRLTLWDALRRLLTAAAG